MDDHRTDDRRCTCPPPLTERSLRERGPYDDARLSCVVHPERERRVEEMLRGGLEMEAVYPLAFTPLAALRSDPMEHARRSLAAYGVSYAERSYVPSPFWRYASPEPDSGRGWARPLEPVADEGFGVGC